MLSCSSLDQAAGGERGDHPVERRAEGLPRVALDLRDPLAVDTGLGERRREPPALQPLVVQEVGERVLAVGRLQPRTGPCATARATAASCSSTRLPASSRSTPLHTNARSVSLSTSNWRASSDALRRAAAAGLLSSCASPAERVAERRELLPLAHDRLGALLDRRDHPQRPFSTLFSSRSSRRKSAPGTAYMRLATMIRPSAWLGSSVSRLVAPK